MMDAAKRARLQAANFTVGTVDEFLGLTAVQSAALETRIRLARALKAVRTRNGWTQVEAARQLGFSQPRLAKLESSGASQVSLDALLGALYTLGATVEEVGGVLADPKNNFGTAAAYRGSAYTPPNK